ncbi:DUF1559 domain-containing protein [Coraliomargarita algicola]|uniref:DUF1559 domain-containing protein n=1 Tax=Coraliomargarita algicola TaxID=3092156 RepID=A0ABZ0RDQ4_9BACT|nr:DUF1559 domain-containing protein [Coraliomargarita sp. J2-16]WPJ94289.1 DUF1559 domain-containing protein [Coraliomargarita sp. J2-16]
MKIYIRAKQKMGFSLIELLSVVAVITILLAILIPALSKVRNQAKAVGCLSNMRQIGLAINMYAMEHNQTLPGPLYLAGGNIVGTKRLPYYIAPYLDRGQAEDGDSLDVFVCPAWADATQGLEGAGIQYIHVKTSAGKDPFGYPGAKVTAPPMTLYDIAEGDGLAQTAVLTELDAQSPIVSSGWGTLAPEPVHGTFRHTLYFDGRVEKTPLDEAP